MITCMPGKASASASTMRCLSATSLWAAWRYAWAPSPTTTERLMTCAAARLWRCLRCGPCPSANARPCAARWARRMRTITPRRLPTAGAAPARVQLQRGPRHPLLQRVRRGKGADAGGRARCAERRGAGTPPVWCGYAVFARAGRSARRRLRRAAGRRRAVCCAKSPDAALRGVPEQEMERPAVPAMGGARRPAFPS